MFCYIHIPFCENRCKYCRFSTFSSKNDLDRQVYVDFLVKSIQNNSQNQEKLDSVYFWWWTPTSLNNSQIEKIINSLKNKFGFKYNIEISLETTISNIGKENLLEWKKLWINRLSLWVQTLNNDSLKEIWRPSSEKIIEKLEVINEIKCESNLAISLDFIIWLPYVKKWEVMKDIKFIVKNYDFINHISLYMLEQYYDYPKKWEKLGISDDEYLNEYLICKNYLEQNGFIRYEISNFAKLWFECNHNKAYWNHCEVMAFWLWAHWFIDWERYAYPNNFRDYYDWKYEYEEKLTTKDIFFEKVMFSLRTWWIEKEFFELLNQEKIKYYINEKLLSYKANKLILCDNWVTLIDYIIKEII